MKSPIEFFEEGRMDEAGVELLRRKHALDSHTFDHLTNFCCYCGQSEEHVTENWIECFGGKGTSIVAISHLRRGDILDAAERGGGPVVA